MRKVAPEAFERARRLLKTEARPLERALFEHFFEGAPAEGAVEALAGFQNEDGGLGHGLESDLRTPSSSALATGHGLHWLKELGQPADLPIVRRALHYLERTLDHEAGVWRIIPPDANDHPHAPWWHDEGGSLARTFDGFLIIPRAQLVGLLRHFGAAPGRLEALTEQTVDDIVAMEPLGGGGGDDLAYALELAESGTLPAPLYERLAPRLRAAAERAVTRDPEQWAVYSIPPLKLAPRPDSLVADLFPEALQANLDWLIERQSADGGWDPTWSWGELYPEVWERVARPEWRGHLTLNALLSLRAFGRMA